MLWRPWVVRAMQDEHVVAPKSVRETGATAGNAFVGSAGCITCHKWAASQPSTGMGMAAIDPAAVGAASALPRDYRSMLFRDDDTTVTLQKTATGLQMSATDGSATVAAPVRWVFGQGHSGRTFILEKDGQFYESRASYYRALENLDLTIGHSANRPTSLLGSLGRQLPEAEVRRCFSCHTSEDVFDGKLDVAKAHPGVTCENCHGAGSEHVASMGTVAGRSTKADPHIFNPGTLPAADLNDFCGSCHRTTRDVLESGVRDIRNIRFQPYRLENSRCYDPTDRRITCVACHDPHRELETSTESYDAKCLACHANRGTARVAQAKAPACPRATKDCASCHMPRLNLPGAHYAFTDHYIRVQQPGMPYPD
ncbi:multiheme c-type cytochrome [Terriglobus aquaticus]|uniref:Multiheme c-type cytochrome n=1 Tax=Terriglobus aquaticus TaxID=940139 RepID=A0ABW9KNV0_9BACT|nr:multiheme c-type cytochrome [Terriglobus aquaticus]